jgi:hypothetical protein
VPITHAGKNNSLADWVNYMKKKKAVGKLPIPHVSALDEIKFEWKANRKQKRLSRNGSKNSMSTRRPTTL